METLEARASAREAFEEQIFLADPVGNWHLCYESRPDFSCDTLPQWVGWSEERRKLAMDKYWRYDARLQRRIHQIYELHDSALFRERLKKRLVCKATKEAHPSTVSSSKRKKQRKKEEQVPPQEPPLSVIEVRVHRVAIKARNAALSKLWHQHIREVGVFADISADGVLASEARKRRVSEIIEKRQSDDDKRREMLKEWSSLSGDSKIERVDWGAIHTET